MVNRNKFWTEREVELLREMWYNRGVTREEMMRVMDRSWFSLQGKQWMMGWRSRTELEQEWRDEELMRRYREIIEV